MKETKLVNKNLFKEKKNLGCKGANGCILHIPEQVLHSCTRIRRIHKRRKCSASNYMDKIKSPSKNKQNKNETWKNCRSSTLNDIPISSTSWAAISDCTCTKTFWLFWVAFCIQNKLSIKILSFVPPQLSINIQKSHFCNNINKNISLIIPSWV